MHIVFAASEGVPFSKTGGLADVVGALPQRAGGPGPPDQRLPAALPPDQADRSATPLCAASPSRSTTNTASARSSRPAASERASRTTSSSTRLYFDREALYGTAVGDYPDNAERFALFSRAVIEASKILGRPASLSLPRLAVGAGPGDAAHVLCGRPGLPRSGHCVHHSQHGLPGAISREKSFPC